MQEYTEHGTKADGEEISYSPVEDTFDDETQSNKLGQSGKSVTKEEENGESILTLEEESKPKTKIKMDLPEIPKPKRKPPQPPKKQEAFYDFVSDPKETSKARSEGAVKYSQVYQTLDGKTKKPALPRPLVSRGPQAPLEQKHYGSINDEEKGEGNLGILNTQDKDIPEDTLALAALIEYHLGKRSTKRQWLQIGFGCVALIMAGTVVLMYYGPTEEYTRNKSLFEKIVLQMGVNIANGGLAYFTTIETLNSFFKKAPEYIVKKITIPENRNKAKIIGVAKNIAVLAASIVAALPYALVAGPNNNYAMKILSEIVVGLSFGFMNAYGLNALLANQFLHLQRKLRSSSKWHHADQIQQSLIFTLQQIVNYELNNGKLSPEFKLGVTKGNKILEVIAEKSRDYKIRPYTKSSYPKWLLTSVVPGAAGSALVVAGLLGYILKTVDIFKDNLLSGKKAESIGLSLVPLSIFIYIGANFGAMSFQDFPSLIYNTGKYWYYHLRKNKYSEEELREILAGLNLPPAMYLYPLATTLGMIGVSGVCLFSFATSVDLIEHSPHFNANGVFANYKTLFMILAAVSSIIFNNFANQKLLFKLVEGYARVYGSPENKEKAIFAKEMLTVADEIRDDVDPWILASNIKALPEEQRFALTNMDSVKQNLEQMLENVIYGLLPENQTNSTFLASRGASNQSPADETEQLLPRQEINEDKVPVLTTGSFWQKVKPSLSNFFSKCCNRRPLIQTPDEERQLTHS